MEINRRTFLGGSLAAPVAISTTSALADKPNDVIAEPVAKENSLTAKTIDELIALINEEFKTKTHVSYELYKLHDNGIFINDDEKKYIADKLNARVVKIISSDTFQPAFGFYKKR